jgi:hypothetical protein
MSATKIKYSMSPCPVSFFTQFITTSVLEAGCNFALQLLALGLRG